MSGSDTALLILLIITLSLSVFTLLMVTSLTDPYWYLHILSIKTHNRKRILNQSVGTMDSDLEQQSTSNVNHSGSYRSTTNNTNIALDSYPMGSSVLERNNHMQEHQPSENESTEEVPDSASNQVISNDNSVQVPQNNVVRAIPQTRDETRESIGEFGSACEKFDVTQEAQAVEYDSAINLSRFEIIGTSTDAVVTDGDNEETGPLKEAEDNHVANPTIIAYPATSTSVFDSAQVQLTPNTPFQREKISEVAKEKSRMGLIRGVADQLSDNLIRVGDLVIVIRPFVGVKESDFPLLQPGDLIRINKFCVLEEDSKGDTVGETEAPKVVEQQLMKKIEMVDLANLSEPLVNESLHESCTQEMIVMKTDVLYRRIYCTGMLLNTYLKESSVHELIWKQREEPEGTEINLLTKDFPLNVVTLEETILKKPSK